MTTDFVPRRPTTRPLRLRTEAWERDLRAAAAAAAARKRAKQAARSVVTVSSPGRRPH